MAEALVMIALSPTMQDGTIAQWQLKEGDAFKSGTALCEVETDKATMTYEAPVSATLLKILLPEGSRAAVGQPIAVYGKPGEDWQQANGLAATAQAPANPAMPKALPVDAKQSSVADSSAASMLPAMPALPALAPSPLAAAASGTIPAAAAEAGARAVNPQRQVGTADQPSGRKRSSPLARTLAAQAGLSLASIRGSGPAGRIVARDVREYAASQTGFASTGGNESAPAVPQPAAQESITPARQAQLSGQPVQERVSRMRATIAGRLGDSYRNAPHYYVRMAIEMDGLLAWRARANQDRPQKLSLNAFMLTLVAKALTRHPELNCVWQGDTILYPGTLHLAMAVALDKGLITPVLRDAQRYGVEELDRRLANLVERARNGQLAPEEYDGAGFTVSNLGMYGVEEFTAIINPPGSAILALGAIREEVIARDHAPAVASVLHATLSADHRSIDGAVAAAFMADLKRLFESPADALL